MSAKLDTRKAAAYLGFTYSSFQHHRRRKADDHPTYIRLAANTVRYDKEALDEWLAKHTTRPKVSV